MICKKHTILIISGILILSSCNPKAAIAPFSYAPKCYDTSWAPTPCQKKEIPKCLLMESADCCGEACSECEEEAPATLCDLIDTALKRSPLTRETWASARLAAAQWGVGQAPFYPQIDFDAYWFALKFPSFFGTGQVRVNKFQEYAPYLTMSYLILDFGTTRAQSRALYQQLIAANWTHNQQIQTLITNVTLDYYAYITNKEKVVAGEANLDDANTTLAATEAKHRTGVSDITDVLMAKTQVAKQLIQLIGDEQGEADSLAALLAEAGLPANACVAVKQFESIIENNDFLQALDSYICLAYQARPDLYSAYAKVLSDRANLTAAQRQLLPQVSFDGTVGQYYFNSGSVNDYGYNTQFSLTFPLFYGWYYINQIREAKAQLEFSKAQLRDVEVQMVKDVVTSYQDFYFAVELVKVNREYVLLAEETFKANLAEYKVGTIDITTLVNSQTNLADARYSLAEAKQQWYDSLTNLTYATGSVVNPREH